MSDDNTDAEAYGRSPEPNPDLRSLDRLVGTWWMSGPPETKKVRRLLTRVLSTPTNGALLGHDGDAVTGAGERPGGRYEATTIRVEQAGRDAAL